MDQQYTVEDLLADDSFREYCQKPQSQWYHQWNERIQSDPSLAKIAAEARTVLMMISPTIPQTEIDEEINKLRQVFDWKESEQKRKSANNRKRVIAVSLPLVIVIIGVYLFVNDNSKLETQQQQHQLASAFKTNTGERKQYILPDGSVIILNSNSTFSFDESFGKSNRNIHLNGDAFFKVAKNPSKPFTVYSNGFSTTAIGTAFYVHGSGRAADYSVDLLEGKVKLQNNKSGETLYLTAGQQASWTKQSSAFVSQHYDTVSLNKWVKGVLTFNNMPVQQVFKELEKWYSVKIEDRRVNPEIISINGDYINAPLEDVLKIICFSLSCSYHFEGTKIIIQ